MPTLHTDARTATKLPDIFRTINGVNLDIGPLDRLRDGQSPIDGSSTISRLELRDQGTRRPDGTTGGTCPRIILRDALGRELDTFTALQEAIYRAKWNVKQSGQSKEPLEWRLPKAPPPARPDLTRTCPPLKHPPVVEHSTGGRTTTQWNHSRVLEFDIDDVGFIQESLQYLPYAPSLSFLRQEILVGPKTYFQIVGTVLLHKKVLSQTEKRHAVYNFPGFCSGCIRMGLCYGCEKSSELHFHEDKPVKTGGGFTYFKKDRPEKQIQSRNPSNWKIHHPDLTLKKLMEEYAGVQLEGVIPDEVKRELDKHGGHRERIVSNVPVSNIPDFAAEMKSLNDEHAKSGLLPDINLKRGGINDDLDNDLENQGQGDSDEELGHNEDIDPKDVNIEVLGIDKNGQAKVSHDGQQENDYDGVSKDEHGKTVQIGGVKNWNFDIESATGPSKYAHDRGRSSSDDRYEHRLPKRKDTDESAREYGRSRRRGGHRDSEGDDDTLTETDGDGTRSRQRRRLYKAPPAFKLKKSPQRSIESRSPFSADRSYNIPKGKVFQVKKSDKALTEFKDFRNVDVSWKEPKKFELKKSDSKSTKFWSGPPKSTQPSKPKKKRERKNRSKSPKFRRVPSPRAVSPDSGLDSELLTATLRRKSTKKSKSHGRKLSANQILASIETEADSQSEMDLQFKPTNHHLDGYHDTAAEYYRNFNIEEFSKRENTLGSHPSHIHQSPPFGKGYSGATNRIIQCRSPIKKHFIPRSLLEQHPLETSLSENEGSRSNFTDLKDCNTSTNKNDHTLPSEEKLKLYNNKAGQLLGTKKVSDTLDNQNLWRKSSLAGSSDLDQRSLDSSFDQYEHKQRSKAIEEGQFVAEEEAEGDNECSTENSFFPPIKSVQFTVKKTKEDVESASALPPVEGDQRKERQTIENTDHESTTNGSFLPSIKGTQFPDWECKLGSESAGKNCRFPALQNQEDSNRLKTEPTSYDTIKDKQLDTNDKDWHKDISKDSFQPSINGNDIAGHKTIDPQNFMTEDPRFLLDTVTRKLRSCKSEGNSSCQSLMDGSSDFDQRLLNSTFDQYDKAAEHKQRSRTDDNGNAFKDSDIRARCASMNIPHIIESQRSIGKRQMSTERRRKGNSSKPLNYTEGDQLFSSREWSPETKNRSVSKRHPYYPYFKDSPESSGIRKRSSETSSGSFNRKSPYYTDGQESLGTGKYLSESKERHGNSRKHSSLNETQGLPSASTVKERSVAKPHNYSNKDKQLPDTKQLPQETKDRKVNWKKHHYAETLDSDRTKQNSSDTGEKGVKRKNPYYTGSQKTPQTRQRSSDTREKGGAGKEPYYPEGEETPRTRQRSSDTREKGGTNKQPYYNASQETPRTRQRSSDTGEKCGTNKQPYYYESQESPTTRQRLLDTREKTGSGKQSYYSEGEESPKTRQRSSDTGEKCDTGKQPYYYESLESPRTRQRSSDTGEKGGTGKQPHYYEGQESPRTRQRLSNTGEEGGIGKQPYYYEGQESHRTRQRSSDTRKKGGTGKQPYFSESVESPRTRQRSSDTREKGGTGKEPYYYEGQESPRTRQRSSDTREKGGTGKEPYYESLEAPRTNQRSSDTREKTGSGKEPYYYEGQESPRTRQRSSDTREKGGTGKEPYYEGQESHRTRQRSSDTREKTGSGKQSYYSEGEESHRTRQRSSDTRKKGGTGKQPYYYESQESSRTWQRSSDTGEKGGTGKQPHYYEGQESPRTRQKLSNTRRNVGTGKHPYFSESLVSPRTRQKSSDTKEKGGTGKQPYYYEGKESPRTKQRSSDTGEKGGTDKQPYYYEGKESPRTKQMSSDTGEKGDTNKQPYYYEGKESPRTRKRSSDKRGKGGTSKQPYYSEGEESPRTRQTSSDAGENGGTGKQPYFSEGEQSPRTRQTSSDAGEKGGTNKQPYYSESLESSRTRQRSSENGVTCPRSSPETREKIDNQDSSGRGHRSLHTGGKTDDRKQPHFTKNQYSNDRSQMPSDRQEQIVASRQSWTAKHEERTRSSDLDERSLSDFDPFDDRPIEDKYGNNRREHNMTLDDSWYNQEKSVPSVIYSSSEISSDDLYVSDNNDIDNELTRCFESSDSECSYETRSLSGVKFPNLRGSPQLKKQIQSSFYPDNTTANGANGTGSVMDRSSSTDKTTVAHEDNKSSDGKDSKVSKDMHLPDIKPLKYQCQSKTKLSQEQKDHNKRFRKGLLDDNKSLPHIEERTQFNKKRYGEPSSEENFLPHVDRGKYINKESINEACYLAAIEVAQFVEEKAEGDNDCSTEKSFSPPIKRVQITAKKAKEDVESSNNLPLVGGDQLKERQTIGNTDSETTPDCSFFPSIKGAQFSEGRCVSRNESNGKNIFFPALENQAVSYRLKREPTLYDTRKDKQLDANDKDWNKDFSEGSFLPSINGIEISGNKTMDPQDVLTKDQRVLPDIKQAKYQSDTKLTQDKRFSKGLVDDNKSLPQIGRTQCTEKRYDGESSSKEYCLPPNDRGKYFKKDSNRNKEFINEGCYLPSIEVAQFVEEEDEGDNECSTEKTESTLNDTSKDKQLDTNDKDWHEGFSEGSFLPSISGTDISRNKTMDPQDLMTTDQRFLSDIRHKEIVESVKKSQPTDNVNIVNNMLGDTKWNGNSFLPFISKPEDRIRKLFNRKTGTFKRSRTISSIQRSRSLDFELESRSLQDTVKREIMPGKSEETVYRLEQDRPLTVNWLSDNDDGSTRSELSYQHGQKSSQEGKQKSKRHTKRKYNMYAPRTSLVSPILYERHPRDRLTDLKQRSLHEFFNEKKVFSEAFNLMLILDIDGSDEEDWNKTAEEVERFYRDKMTLSDLESDVSRGEGHGYHGGRSRSGNYRDTRMQQRYSLEPYAESSENEIHDEKTAANMHSIKADISDHAEAANEDGALKKTPKGTAHHKLRHENFARDSKPYTRKPDDRNDRDFARGGEPYTRRLDGRNEGHFARGGEPYTRRTDGRNEGDFARDGEPYTRRTDGRNEGDFARDGEPYTRRFDGRNEGDFARGGKPYRRTDDRNDRDFARGGEPYTRRFDGRNEGDFARDGETYRRTDGRNEGDFTRDVEPYTKRKEGRKDGGFARDVESYTRRTDGRNEEDLARDGEPYTRRTDFRNEGDFAREGEPYNRKTDGKNEGDIARDGEPYQRRTDGKNDGDFAKGGEPHTRRKDGRNDGGFARDGEPYNRGFDGRNEGDFAREGEPDNRRTDGKNVARDGAPDTRRIYGKNDRDFAREGEPDTRRIYGKNEGDFAREGEPYTRRKDNRNEVDFAREGEPYNRRTDGDFARGREHDIRRIYGKNEGDFARDGEPYNRRTDGRNEGDFAREGEPYTQRKDSWNDGNIAREAEPYNRGTEGRNEGDFARGEPYTRRKDGRNEGDIAREGELYTRRTDGRSDGNLARGGEPYNIRKDDRTDVNFARGGEPYTRRKDDRNDGDIAKDGEPSTRGNDGKKILKRRDGRLNILSTVVDQDGNETQVKGYGHDPNMTKRSEMERLSRLRSRQAVVYDDRHSSSPQSQSNKSDGRMSSALSTKSLSRRSSIREYQKAYHKLKLKLRRSDRRPGHSSLQTEEDKRNSDMSSPGYKSPYMSSPGYKSPYIKHREVSDRTLHSRHKEGAERSLRGKASIDEIGDHFGEQEGYFDENMEQINSQKVPTKRQEDYQSTGQSHLSESFHDEDGEHLITYHGKTFDDFHLQPYIQQYTKIKQESTKEQVKIKEQSKKTDDQKRDSKGIVVYIEGSEFVRIITPPLVPSEVDNDKGSLTSFEPDLELEFDDVINVEELEGIDEIETVDAEDFERLKREEKERRRRHKSKKKKKRREASREKKNVSDNDAGDHKKSENADNGNEENGEIPNHADEFEVDLTGRDRRNSETGENEEGKLETLKGRNEAYESAEDDVGEVMTTRENTNEAFIELQNSFAKELENDADEKDEKDGVKDGDKMRRKKHGRNKKERHNRSHRKVKDGDDIETARKAHDVNKKDKIDTVPKEKELEFEKKVKGGKKTERKRRSKERKEGKRLGLRREASTHNSETRELKSQAHRKTRRKSFGSLNDSDFNNLPSVQTQCAKIVGDRGKGIYEEEQGVDLHETDEGYGLDEPDEQMERRRRDPNDHYNDSDTCDEEEENIKKEGRYPKRPSSAKNGELSDGEISISGMNMRKYRSLSLPALCEIEQLIEQMGSVTLEELRQPITVPVYLPSFSPGPRIQKKQFKLNPKRVPGRQERSMSISGDMFVGHFAQQDSTNKSELEPVREETLTPTPEPVMDRGPTPLALHTTTPADTNTAKMKSRHGVNSKKAKHKVKFASDALENNDTNFNNNNSDDASVGIVVENLATAVGNSVHGKLGEFDERKVKSALSRKKSVEVIFRSHTFGNIGSEKHYNGFANDKCRTESPPPPPKKREIVKKEKKERKPKTPLHEPEEEPFPPPPVPKEKTPSPKPSRGETPVSREISFVFVKEPSIPELPPIEVPALPEIPEKQKYESKLVKKERKLIEVTPDIPEQKTKLPPPPKLAPRIKTRGPPRKNKVAEAPVTTEELQQLSDPLDFLAKYCIINPDRLPFYERVFNGAVNVQSPRYSRDQAGKSDIVHLPPAQLSEHELGMLKDLTVITHAQSPKREGVSVPEQYLEKLNYSIEFIKNKQDGLQDHMHKLQGEKIHLMAQMAKSMDRDIARLDYKSKSKKKKKKKKKKKSEDLDYDTMGAMGSMKNFQPTRATDITDEVIVSRMDDKMMKKVKKDPAVKQLTLEISRDIEKLKNYDQRVLQVEDEKDLVGLYCMDYFFNEESGSAAPYSFRRQQSRLYQKLHPDPDVQMNIEEVSAALQQINNKLLTEKEFQYIFFILDLPKREKINFRLFSIIAALSEKVTQMDPVIRKLINKVDYNALDIKMEKSKELFELLQDESQMPTGNAPADILAVELTAGGLTPEHTSYVLSKFNREGRGFVDFLDFVTYVPLFIEIHKRIVDDPFNDSLDV